MGLFDGKLDWKDALFFPSAITDAAVAGGKKAKNWLSPSKSGSGSTTPDFSRAAYAPGSDWSSEYGAGIASGSAQQDNAVGMLGAGALQGARYSREGRDVARYGFGAARNSMDRSVGARGSQEDALRLQSMAARGQAPSQAELMLRANAGRAARQNMGLAASSRGGNQAAAMRNASMANSQAQLELGQQAGALRAAEMAQARDAYMAGSTGIRGQDIGSAQVGASLAGLGLGAQGQGISLQNQAAGAIGELGAGRERAYLGAETGARTAELGANVDLERARLAAAAAAASGDKALLGSLFTTGGTVLGAIGGGPAGAVGGAAAGDYASNAVSGTSSGLQDRNAISGTTQGLASRPGATGREKSLGIAPGTGDMGQQLLAEAGMGPRNYGPPVAMPGKPAGVNKLDEEQRRARQQAAMRSNALGGGGGKTIMPLNPNILTPV